MPDSATKVTFNLDTVETPEQRTREFSFADIGYTSPSPKRKRANSAQYDEILLRSP